MTELPDHEFEELRPDHDLPARPEEVIADAARAPVPSAAPATPATPTAAGDHAPMVDQDDVER